MGQLGGKDLRDLKGLPRNPVGSYLRKAVAPTRPSAPVRVGKRAPILQRFPSLKLYNPKAWTDWLKFYARNRIGLRHNFNFYHSTDRGIYPLRSAGGGPVRVAMAGDWGTGTDEARQVAGLMAATRPDFTIHLGDVYYVGSLAEVNEHFLGVDNPHNDFTPCKWPHGAIGSFALNGNHEMYGLGDAYFELLLPQMGMRHPRRRQHASFFCLENDNWRVLGLDTAYNSIGWPFLERFTTQTSRLENALVEWLRDDVRLGDASDRRGLVLLSHHQYYSAFDDWYETPARQLVAFIDRPVVWFWGHEHRLAVYGRHKFGDGIEASGRCIGHGGMPVDRYDASQPVKHPECPPVFTDNRAFPNDEGLDVGYNGYVSLTFDGPTLTADYLDLTGQSLWKEQWRVNRSDGSLQLSTIDQRRQLK